MVLFDLTKQVDTSQTININYIPMGVTSIMNDNVNNWISGMCGRGSSSNVTYTNSGVTKEYKADKLWLVGNKNGEGQTPLHQVNGKEHNAELFIRNVDVNNGDPIYTCFLLNVAQIASQNGQIDGIVRAATADPPVTSLTVDLNADIFRINTSNAVYIQYKSNGRNVFIYSEPITVSAVALLGLENNLTLFKMAPETDSDYSVIASPVPGDWMECDYVPIDSDDVAANNLSMVIPASSGLIQDQSANQSLKTMVMFILFVVFIGVAYFIIPTAYLYTAKLAFDYMEDVTEDAQKSKLPTINAVLSSVIAGTALILLLIGAGVFGDTANIPNAGLMLLIGMSLGIFYMIALIVIKSKTSSIKNWPISQIQEEMGNE
jgi:hypothetical protein